MKDFKIFKDKDLKEPVENPIDLGKLKIGETKQIKLYIQNATVFPYEEIDVKTNREEVKVISAPVELREKTSAELILEWKPLVDTHLKVKPNLSIEGFKVKNL